MTHTSIDIDLPVFYLKRDSGANRYRRQGAARTGAPPIKIIRIDKFAKLW
jgi:hypothetical protein